MAKELPYFKFEPAEYLTKDAFLLFSCSGIVYKSLLLLLAKKLQTIKRSVLKTLKFRERTRGVNCRGAIDLIDNDIYINFLDVQYEEVVVKVKPIKPMVRGGRPTKNQS
jgi:hypothetical protein